jgi:hypothetical protein
MPFGLPGPATLADVVGCACIYLLGLLGTPKASCCGGAAEVVSGLFGRSSRGTASETCRLWVPAAGLAVAAAAVGRVCPCKQLTHSQQVIAVVGNDDWGAAA